MIGGVTRHILPHLPEVPHLHVNSSLAEYRKIPKISPSKYKPPGGLYLENRPETVKFLPFISQASPINPFIP